MTHPYTCPLCKNGKPCSVCAQRATYRHFLETFALTVLAILGGAVVIYLILTAT